MKSKEEVPSIKDGLTGFVHLFQLAWMAPTVFSKQHCSFCMWEFSTANVLRNNKQTTRAHFLPQITPCNVLYPTHFEFQTSRDISKRHDRIARTAHNREFVFLDTHCHLHSLIFNSDYCSTWWISNLQHRPYDIMYVNYNRKRCLKELSFHCFVSPFLIDVNVSFLHVKVYTTEARRCYVGTPAQMHIYSWMYIHPYVHTHQMIHLGQASMYKNYLLHSVACMWTQK